MFLEVAKSNITKPPSSTRNPQKPKKGLCQDARLAAEKYGWHDDALEWLQSRIDFID